MGDFNSENRPTSVRLWRLEQSLHQALERIAKLEKENASLKTRLDYLQGVQDEEAITELNSNYHY